MTDGLRVRLLGAPSIELDGRPVATDTRKAVALLAYLAVSEQPQRRAALAALLWPEAETERARGALRRTLSVTRSALGDRWLEADGETIDLQRVGLWVDVSEFRRAAAGGRLEEAAALYRGDFLTGFSLRDSEPFDEWQRAQAEALREELKRVLTRLTDDAVAKGDEARAIAHARRGVETDPLDESAHVALIRAYARAGDRSSALRQYHECVRVLDRELGVAPLPDTRALFAAIEKGELASAPRSIEGAAAEAVGDAHTLHGDYARAIAGYEQALAHANANERAAVEHKLARVHHRRGDWLSAERHYAAARAASATDAERARILADWSLAVHRAGDGARADRLARESLALATSCGDRRALAQAHNVAGILAGARDPRAARTHLETSAKIAEELGELEPLIAALNNLALADRRAGDLPRAKQLTERALGRAIEVGDRHRIAALHNNLADILRQQGAEPEAMRHLRRAVTLFAEIGRSAVAEPEIWKLVEW